MTNEIRKVLLMRDAEILSFDKLVIRRMPLALSDTTHSGSYVLLKELTSLRVRYDNVHNPFDSRSSSLESICVPLQHRRVSPYACAEVPCICVFEVDLFLRSLPRDTETVLNGETVKLVDAQRIRMFQNPCLSSRCGRVVVEARKMLVN